ncbi:hypothetical protein AN161_01215 [Lysinibacillus sp. FJAT-14222]|nr:hypothetical protein AN161_01215 [Lysinibacillus sp. FJAT-14222]
MIWLAQGYESSYRTINRFRIHPEVKELLRQFRCQLVQEKLIENEAIFIDGAKIEANANKFTFVWKKSVEQYSTTLVEKSNQLYDELLKKEIILEMERENPNEFSIEELSQIVEKLDEKVQAYDQKIEASTNGSERKKIRSERKAPKQVLIGFALMAVNLQKYTANNREIG